MDLQPLEASQQIQLQAGEKQHVYTVIVLAVLVGIVFLFFFVWLPKVRAEKPGGKHWRCKDDASGTCELTDEVTDFLSKQGCEEDKSCWGSRTYYDCAFSDHTHDKEPVPVRTGACGTAEFKTAWTSMEQCAADGHCNEDQYFRCEPGVGCVSASAYDSKDPRSYINKASKDGKIDGSGYAKCAAECVPRWKCDAGKGGSCTPGSPGLCEATVDIAGKDMYTSQKACVSKCAPKGAKYSCCPDTGACIVDSSGKYSSLGECAQACCGKAGLEFCSDGAGGGTCCDTGNCYECKDGKCSSTIGDCDLCINNAAAKNIDCSHCTQMHCVDNRCERVQGCPDGTIWELCVNPPQNPDMCGGCEESPCGCYMCLCNAGQVGCSSGLKCVAKKDGTSCKCEDQLCTGDKCYICA